MLLSGHAEAIADGEEPATAMQPGAALGEIGVLHDTPRSRTVIAKDHLVALFLPAHELRLAAGRERHEHAAGDITRVLPEALAPVPAPATETEVEAAS